MDRPIVHAELLNIRRKLGEAFPVIDLKMHPNNYNGTNVRMIPYAFPTVLKVGSADAGYGKVREDKPLSMCSMRSSW